MSCLNDVVFSFIKKAYATQMILVNGRDLRVVFITTPFFVDMNKMLSTPRTDAIMTRPALYSRSVFVESDDSLVIATGVNDNECLLVRVTGVASLLQQAIDADKKVADSKCKQNTAEVARQMNSWMVSASSAEIDRIFAGKNSPVTAR